MRWMLLGLAVVACRDGSAPAPTPAPDRRAPALQTPAHAGSAVGPRPTLIVDEPETSTPGEQLAVAKAFDVEPVDRFWKTNTEAEIHRRVPGANGVECHSTLCKVTLIGNERELGKQLDELETERSLRGIADSILLTAPDQREDGTIALRAYARFTHKQP